jgi:hypothetical protein
MAAKITRVIHKIAIQLHLVAENCTICRFRSRRPVRKLLFTPRIQKQGYQWFRFIPLGCDWNLCNSDVFYKMSYQNTLCQCVQNFAVVFFGLKVFLLLLLLQVSGTRRSGASSYVSVWLLFMSIPFVAALIILSLKAVLPIILNELWNIMDAITLHTKHKV